jgi:hypothetical protein
MAQRPCPMHDQRDGETDELLRLGRTAKHRPTALKAGGVGEDPPNHPRYMFRFVGPGQTAAEEEAGCAILIQTHTRSVTSLPIIVRSPTRRRY